MESRSGVWAAKHVDLAHCGQYVASNSSTIPVLRIAFSDGQILRRRSWWLTPELQTSASSNRIPPRQWAPVMLVWSCLAILNICWKEKKWTAIISSRIITYSLHIWITPRIIYNLLFISIYIYLYSLQNSFLCSICCGFTVSVTKSKSQYAKAWGLRWCVQQDPEPAKAAWQLWYLGNPTWISNTRPRSLAMIHTSLRSKDTWCISIHILDLYPRMTSCTYTRLYTRPI